MLEDNCGGCQAICQQSAQRRFSRLSRPHAIVLLERAWWHFQRGGARSILCQAAAWFDPSRKAVKRKNATPLHIEVLGLQPGDWVEVKAYPEIQQTLDPSGATRGLQFLTGMIPFCGRRFRVHKRMETLFLEESRQIRKMKHTVLLENVFCDGSSYHCDRSCFYYWREAWLRKIEGSGSQADPGFQQEVRS